MRVEPGELVVYLLTLALHLDVFGPASKIEADLLEKIRLPLQYETRLLAEIRAGRPYLDPGALRWVVREISAWTVARPTSVPEAASEEAESLAMDVFFSFHYHKPQPAIVAWSL